MSIEPDIGSSTVRAHAAVPFLSGAEWGAVIVALKDSDRGQRVRSASDGPLVRVWRWFSGIQPPRPLADPRLDALRRFVIAVRGHGERIADMMPEMCSRGFSREQVEALARIVG